MDQYLLQWTHLVHVELTLAARQLSVAGGELSDKIVTEAQRTTKRLLLTVMMKINGFALLYEIWSDQYLLLPGILEQSWQYCRKLEGIFFCYVMKEKLWFEKIKCLSVGCTKCIHRRIYYINVQCEKKQMCVSLPAISVPVIHLHFNWPERFKTEHLETWFATFQTPKREWQLNWWMLSDLNMPERRRLTAFFISMLKPTNYRPLSRQCTRN